MIPRWIGTFSGVPADPQFGLTEGQGTPIVINTLTDTGYYLKPGVGPVALLGGGSGGTEMPVDSIFISVSPTDPATSLGYGTWALFGQGRMLVSLDSTDPDFDTPEETGGSKTATF